MSASVIRLKNDSWNGGHTVKPLKRSFSSRNVTPISRTPGLSNAGMLPNDWQSKRAKVIVAVDIDGLI